MVLRLEHIRRQTLAGQCSGSHCHILKSHRENGIFDSKCSTEARSEAFPPLIMCSESFHTEVLQAKQQEALQDLVQEQTNDHGSLQKLSSNSLKASNHRLLMTSNALNTFFINCQNCNKICGFQ